ncbi:uncharacterized protein BDR25DRAFT_317041 [Lindgomyces ingoldianus]|uniref:Uncharacterized protein n=1 Tax=Lindgomyces ingoldianus TaxID=673940 RepID=A0ACB6QMD5_9PLEO|nr:uncharacterized protein BDR25DRAFT_317041 [Lindgomyces ingoldianus]KAF2467287.1 hypothetical protein BDR25DRAFT_317041 [Lindgomyces ingoldianus]
MHRWTAGSNGSGVMAATNVCAVDSPLLAQHTLPSLVDQIVGIVRSLVAHRGMGFGTCDWGRLFCWVVGTDDAHTGWESLHFPAASDGVPCSAAVDIPLATAAEARPLTTCVHCSRGLAAWPTPHGRGSPGGLAVDSWLLPSLTLAERPPTPNPILFVNTKTCCPSPSQPAHCENDSPQGSRIWGAATSFRGHHSPSAHLVALLVLRPQLALLPVQCEPSSWIAGRAAAGPGIWPGHQGWECAAPREPPPRPSVTLIVVAERVCFPSLVCYPCAPRARQK